MIVHPCHHLAALGKVMRDRWGQPHSLAQSGKGVARFKVGPPAGTVGVNRFKVGPTAEIGSPIQGSEPSWSYSQFPYCPCQRSRSRTESNSAPHSGHLPWSPSPATGKPQAVQTAPRCSLTRIINSSDFRRSTDSPQRVEATPAASKIQPKIANSPCAGRATNTLIPKRHRATPTMERWRLNWISRPMIGG